MLVTLVSPASRLIVPSQFRNNQIAQIVQIVQIARPAPVFAHLDKTLGGQ
jgi:hypothetical protein